MSFNAILLKCVRLGVKGSFTLAYSAAKTHVTTANQPVFGTLEITAATRINHVCYHVAQGAKVIELFLANVCSEIG
jgi:hypothetical protein